MLGPIVINQDVNLLLLLSIGACQSRVLLLSTGQLLLDLIDLLVILGHELLYLSPILLLHLLGLLDAALLHLSKGLLQLNHVEFSLVQLVLMVLFHSLDHIPQLHCCLDSFLMAHLMPLLLSCCQVSLVLLLKHLDLELHCLVTLVFLGLEGIKLHLEFIELEFKVVTAGVEGEFSLL